MRYIHGAGAFGGRLRAHIVREEAVRQSSQRQGTIYRALCSGTFSVGPTDAPLGPTCGKCEGVRARLVEVAQSTMRNYAATGRPATVAWCAVCGAEVRRAHIRDTNYCDKPECQREQRRRNQAAWRARKAER